MTSPNFGGPHGPHGPHGPGPSGNNYNVPQFGGSTAWNGGGQHPQQPQQPSFGQPQFGTGHPQFNQHPQQAPATARKIDLGWPAWTYLGLTLLTLVGSFLTVVEWAAGLEGIGSAGVSWNWWGAFSYQGTGLGSLATDYIPAEIGYDSGLVVSTAAVLVLLVAATVVMFIGRIRAGAILGIVASGAQLLAAIIAFAQIDPSLGMGMGVGWYIWLIASLAGLAVSIYLVATGRGKKIARPQDPYATAGTPGVPGQQWGQQPQQNQWGQGS